MSLRRRVLIGVLLIAAVLVGTNVLLSGTFRSFLIDRVDQQLVTVGGRPQFRGPPGPRADPGVSEFFLAWYTPATNRLTSGNADIESPPALTGAQLLAQAGRSPRDARPFTVGSDDGGTRWRLIAFNGPNRTVNVVGISLDDVEATLARTRFVQATGTLAVLVALGVVSWWVLRLGVHPLEDMARTADAIAGGDLSRRVAHPGGETEAGRLGIAINSMLERIEEAFRQREASEEKVRRFAADASHELRTPLTSIQGYAELWRSGALADKDALADAMRRIEEEGKRMAALVEDLLVLARLDQGRPVERRPVRLDQIAEDGVRDARAVEPDRPVALEVEPVTVEADDAHLRQIVANLLSNARVHTPPGTPVRVRVTRSDGAACLEVADEGPGMPPDVAAHVFERFYRADPSRARAGGGTGLGLSIVAALAEAHGGQARVDSTPGAGSRFTVDLPMSDTRRPTPPG